jgi:hypothetical protein
MARRLLEGPSESKGSALKGNLMVDATRGVVRVRKWPRKRGKPKNLAVYERSEWFRVVLELIKRMEPGFLEWCRDKTKGTNIYPRDLAMQILSGHFTILYLPDGTKMFPRNFMVDTSTALDVLGQDLGDILVRGPEFWAVIPLGSEGQVLTIPAPGELPVWADAGGGAGGLWWKELTPLTGQFPTQVIEGSASSVDFRNDADCGMILQGAIANNDFALMQLMPAPAYPFTVSMHLNCTMQSGVPIAGIVLRNSSTGLRNIFGIDPIGGPLNTLVRRATHTTFNANLGSFAQRTMGLPMFLRVVAASATDISYWVSGDGKNWGLIQPNVALGQVAGLDQIGVGLTSRNGAIGTAYMAVDMWEVT